MYYIITRKLNGRNGKREIYLSWLKFDIDFYLIVINYREKKNSQSFLKGHSGKRRKNQRTAIAIIPCFYIKHLKTDFIPIKRFVRLFLVVLLSFPPFSTHASHNN